MNILTVCYFGQTRSVFLRDYLREKGYEAQAIGVSAGSAELKRAISAADLIVCVHPDVEKQLRGLTNVEGEKIITLDVADESKYSRDALIEQMNRYLPFETE